MKIVEIFSSAQGEGLRMGEPAVFLRLGGCSLDCPFCDTPGARAGGRAMTPARVAAQVAARAPFKGVQVVITGGEPLEQDLGELVEILLRSDYFLSVETNGTRFQDLPVHWWTLSPKAAAGFRIHPRLRPLAAEVKIVVTPEVNVNTVRRLRQATPRAPLFLQPNARDAGGGYAAARELYSACLEAGIRGVRLGLQLHRVYAIP